MQGSITRDGEYVVIRTHIDDVHGLRVALQPCTCKAAKSNSTADIRARLDKGLARAVSQKSFNSRRE